MSTAWSKEAILVLTSGVVLMLVNILLSVFILLRNKNFRLLRGVHGAYHRISSPVDGSERDIELGQIDPAQSTAASSALKPVTADQILGFDKRSQLEGLHGQADSAKPVPRDLTVALGGRLSNPTNHGPIDATRTINPWELEKQPNPVLFPHLRNIMASTSGEGEMSGSSQEAAHALSKNTLGQHESTSQYTSEGSVGSAEDSVRSSFRGQSSIRDYFPVVPRPHALQLSTVSPTTSHDQILFVLPASLPGLCESIAALSDDVDSMDLETPRTSASSTSSETNLIVYSPSANGNCQDDSEGFWDHSLRKLNPGLSAKNRRGKHRAVDELAPPHVIPAPFVYRASIDTSSEQRTLLAGLGITSISPDNSQTCTDTNDATSGRATCEKPTAFNCTQCARVFSTQGKLKYAPESYTKFLSLPEIATMSIESIFAATHAISVPTDAIFAQI
ncbi:hypothetical protein EK21DRAFT_91031 [Setomelanomma holmii]|uniref:Uncharacterized protein n=1 Tax=Setomelanomma holmii TaxID=210430 RepID=A0A9P4LJR3_9PLEO|nr:hypothetical protein EK21DRAFT_91031 [Setomelanomma holmii]